jgi:aryl-alcohol dehydrogenase-like predicted oxidoreductase
VSSFAARTTLGRSGLRVSKLGLGASFGAPAACYFEAFERGVNYFYWGSYRRGLMGEALREIARQKREEIRVVIQSYSRWGWPLERWFEAAIRKLGIDHADVLLLGWFNNPPPRGVLDAALELKQRGRVSHVAISSHRRTFFSTLLDDETYSIWHVRYNAAHRGAERDVFPHLEGRGEAQRPGVVTYTATSWGQLCDPKRTPPDERTPTGTDCYRFAISNPNVDLCIAGPDNTEQMSQALAALELGPMGDEELEWMRRVGDHIYRRDKTAGVRDGPS